MKDDVAPSLTYPGATRPQKPHISSRNFLYAGLFFLITFITWKTLGVVSEITSFFDTIIREDSTACPQADVLAPEQNGDLWGILTEKYGTNEFKYRAIDWLGGAVRVPTESFDDMGPVGQDPRWGAFVPFHSYLRKAFPLVHSTLKLSKVNTHGLLYEWKGSDTLLKPILLAAHQDVVPVDPKTTKDWTYPPYSGFFDGQKLWGRGSSDDKSGLIGILSSVESLLEQKFSPTRTVILAFGFDEEISGTHGAKYLSEAMLDTYGKDAFAFIVDEGGGFVESYGSVIATPGIAEKGYIDVKVEVTSPGGHSSIPPDHTSIGILSALLVKFEENPYKTHLTRDDPLFSTMQCIGEHGADVSSGLRKTIKRSAKSNQALRSLEKEVFKNPVYKHLVGTTQAIDLIQGGVKTNALPEQAWAVVNHRISVISSVGDIMAHDSNLLRSLAEHFNLTYEAFGRKLTPTGAASSGTLTLSNAFQSHLEPAPVTPVGKNAAPYQLLSGTIKATYNSHRSLHSADSITVAPGMPSGNTDTRYYWDLSKHIFRYNHHNSGKTTNRLAGGVHTVNEAIGVDSFVEMIRFFTTLILNADESKTL